MYTPELSAYQTGPSRMRRSTKQTAQQGNCHWEHVQRQSVSRIELNSWSKLYAGLPPLLTDGRKALVAAFGAETLARSISIIAASRKALTWN